MKKEWTNPEAQDLDLAQTENSNLPDASADGVFLGWLDKEGTDCSSVCS